MTSSRRRCRSCATRSPICGRLRSQRPTRRGSPRCSRAATAPSPTSSAPSSDAAYAAKIFIEEGGANATSFDKQARAYGFKKCGTEDEEEEEVKPDRSTFSAPKKSYIAQADAICAAANKRFSRLEERYLMDFPLEIDTWAKFLPRIVEVARPQLEELERLTPPAADKQRIDALLDRQQAVLEKFAEAGKVAGDGDEDAFLEVGRPMFSDSDKLDADLRAYGFRECGAEE